MATDLYSILLAELGSHLGISDLHPDRNNSCLIKLKNGVSLQIELDQKRDFLILTSDLGSLFPGRYRENILREALKSNGLPEPRHGIFAMNMKSDMLVLFTKLSLRELNGEKIMSALMPFAEKAKEWKDALGRGDVPTVGKPISSGIFGLRR